MGFDTQPSVSPVVPVVIGDQALTFKFWRKLTDLGLFASPVVKPAVENELVRTVFMATHTDDHIDRALEMFQKGGRDLGIIPYERPHTRVEVKMARPGVTGFYSSHEGDTTATGAQDGGARLEILDVLTQAERALGAAALQRRRDDHLAAPSTRGRRTTKQLKQLAAEALGEAAPAADHAAVGGHELHVPPAAEQQQLQRDA